MRAVSDNLNRFKTVRVKPRVRTYGPDIGAKNLARKRYTKYKLLELRLLVFVTSSTALLARSYLYRELTSVLVAGTGSSGKIIEHIDELSKEDVHDRQDDTS